MSHKIELLDCTLRDGAYIVNANFGIPAIKGIIKKMQDANVDIIECGWLKNAPHTEGSSFFHLPKDLEPYLIQKSQRTSYVAMIDWDRYDVAQLPNNDEKLLSAIRVVFPYGKYREGIAVGKKIAEKGYHVYFQTSNTLAYSNAELVQLVEEVNQAAPEALSIADTFGAMYPEDLERIVTVLHQHLSPEIKLGFHSHNNLQLSFALSMYFVERMAQTDRKCFVDASLCGMGRGAGNATTELMASYLNRKHHCNYDMNQIMDAIDIYMPYFQENYSWGYSTPYFISGMYCCHVNNIAYLQENHRTNAQDMRNIIESLELEDRRHYDYDLLENKYLENQNRIVDDADLFVQLEEIFKNRTLLLIAPGKTCETKKEQIQAYIKEHNPIVIGVNAINPSYTYDYLFMVNMVRYQYAKDIYPAQFKNTQKILLSNIKIEPSENEWIINFNRVVKRGWKYFDNAVINLLRLLDKLHVSDVAIAGFDGFKHHYNESYADQLLPTLNPDNHWDELNEEIDAMFQELKASIDGQMNLVFITESIFDH